MSAGNTITLVGNTTRDVEMRYTPNGQPVATFGLAHNHRFQRAGSSEWEDKPSFFDVVCYGTLGENVAESLTRGARVMVSGRLEQRSWETQDGEKRSKIEVVADEVGPSLRWASAEVTKNDRADNGRGRQPAAAPAGGSSSYDYDEEPF